MTTLTADRTNTERTRRPESLRRISYAHRGGEPPLLGSTIHAFLRDVAARVPDRDAVVSVPQAVRLTYAELFREVDRVAKGLLALGVARGDRVGVWAVDNIEWLLLQVATARVGAVLVNINPAYRLAELEHALRAARIRTLFLMPAFKKSAYAEMVRKLCPECERGAPHEFSCARLPELKQLVLYDPDDPDHPARPAPGFHTWPEVLTLGETIGDRELQERSASLDADDPINIQFTSGTTGFPKPVVLTHMNILNNGFFVGRLLGLDETDRLCVPLPFYHCFGMVVSNLGCLTHGAAIVIPAPHFDAEAVLAAIEKERCTVLHGVPTMFVALLEHEDYKRRDLTSLKKGIMAGAPCPPELMQRVIHDLGMKGILIGYGQTEASPVTHLTRPDDSFERRIGTVGTNLPHQEVKIVEPQSGVILPVGHTGEICFRGYHVMRGYYGMEKETAEAIDEAGWLHSGDLGEMDADGYVRITGRLKEMIIRGGENIYPAEIEAFYCTHPKVAQAAVFGVADPRWGEEVGAWIQLHEGAAADVEELREYARENLAYFKVPRYLRIVDTFPMTVTGKIRKFRIRETVEAELGQAAPVSGRAAPGRDAGGRGPGRA